MSKPPQRRFRLVLPNANGTVLIPRPTPASVRRQPLMTVIMEHIDHLQVLAVEKPDALQGILDATKLLARQCQKQAAEPRRRR